VFAFAVPPVAAMTVEHPRKKILKFNIVYSNGGNFLDNSALLTINDD
jgi:hypothetical protein